MAGVDEKLKAARELGDFASRSLNPEETRIARQVFRDTLNLARVSLAAGLGLQGRMWTEPDWEVRIYTLGLYQSHTLHVGPEGFVHGMQSTPYLRKSLVHELTHVWQAQVQDGYLLAAGFRQLVDKDPYAYAPGQPWESYSVEQQAQIVEDWYGSGAAEDGTSDLFPYIRDVIRMPLGPLGSWMPFHPYHR